MLFCRLQGRCSLLIEIESSVASRVFSAFIAAYPDGSYSGEPVTETPAKWPHLNIVEVDQFESGYTLLPSATVVYDVNIYSNLVSGAKQECRKIMDLVDTAMKQFGSWNLVFLNQTKNADNRIYRVSARYRGIAVKESVVGDMTNYRIYSR